ncbi:MAG: ribosome-associated translation inhibitor RaiA [Anaerolineales bacterium]
MTIEVEISGRNMNVDNRTQDYVAKKVSKLDRYLADIDEARVDLAYIKSARNVADRHVAQITVRGKGFILRSEERADAILAAFDQALDKVQRRMERFKGKRQRVRTERTADAIAEIAEPIVEEEETEPIIARRKRFALPPMDEAEAIEQMQMLGHENFFIFFNANTNAVNVLYKRRDGTYGLIEPELG